MLKNMKINTKLISIFMLVGIVPLAIIGMISLNKAGAKEYALQQYRPISNNANEPREKDIKEIFKDKMFIEKISSYFNVFNVREE